VGLVGVRVQVARAVAHALAVSARILEVDRHISAAASASNTPMVLLDLGAVARIKVACDKWKRPSGMPTRSKAAAQLITEVSALGSARPTSSLARMISLRRMKRGSSPAYSMRASQYSAASG
jgi:hypothetical protein